MPAPLDGVLLGALVVAAGGLAIAPRPRAWAGAALALTVVLVLGDQSRWQPWLYQYALMVAALALARSTTETLTAWRLVLVALYVWGGIQKLNVTFVTKLFPWMLEPLAGPRSGPGPVVIGAGVAVALVEVAIGVALLFPRTRKTGVVAAVATHALVLALLGPLGHGQNHVVWPWNLALAALAVVLFWRDDEPARRIVVPRRIGLQAALVVLVGILPAASFRGWWDAYLSGALYSGNIPAGFIVMSDTSPGRLPAEVRRYVKTTSDGLHLLDLWEWSVAELRAPSYPEPRVLRRVAAAVCRQAGMPPDVLLVVLGRPGVLSGRRDVSRHDCAALVRD